LVPSGLAVQIEHASRQPTSQAFLPFNARAHATALSPEKQQQQFEKMMKTLLTSTLVSTSTLVRGLSCQQTKPYKFARCRILSEEPKTMLSFKSR
jgi:hypothetical protein